MQSGGWQMTISHRFIETNGIRMHLAEAGDGPTVLLCHGFPECWYSWRHQLEALAAAGYRAIAQHAWLRADGQTGCDRSIYSIASDRRHGRVARRDRHGSSSHCRT